MAAVEEIRKAQRAEGPALILANGTATPSNRVLQIDFPDYFFRITNCENMIDLKEKLKCNSKKSMIQKRYMHLIEEILKKNPNMCANMAPSLDARLNILREEIPKLGKEATEKAIKEWGQPESKITHLVFCTNSIVGIPREDYQLAQLHCLNLSMKRLYVLNQGCFAGGTVLRIGKNLAENNKGAHILSVCFEMNIILFRGPTSDQMDCFCCKNNL